MDDDLEAMSRADLIAEVRVEARDAEKRPPESPESAAKRA